MNLLADNRLSLIALLVLGALTLFLYGQLPDEISTGFAEMGDDPELISKSLAAFFIPGIYLLALVLTNIIVAMSPEKFAMLQSRRPMDSIIFALGLLMCFLQYALLLNDGQFEFFVRYFSYGVAGFLIIAGNVFGKIERNFVIGLRLPWTMDSDASWRRSHRLAGKCMVTAGIVMIVINFFYVSLWMTVALLAGSISLPILWVGIDRLIRPENNASSH